MLGLEMIYAPAVGFLPLLLVVAGLIGLVLGDAYAAIAKRLVLASSTSSLILAGLSACLFVLFGPLDLNLTASAPAWAPMVGLYFLGIGLCIYLRRSTAATLARAPEA